MKSLSLGIFKIFAKIAFLPLDLGPRSKVMAPNESPYMVSYMSTIEMNSLSLYLNESPYMVSYMSTIEMKSLSLVVFGIFVKIAF